MPHKHKRKADDDEYFDLPPSIRAAPFPVGKARAPNPAPRNKKRKVKQVDGYGADDTPKEFARLMALKTSGKRRSSLDDGRRTRSKKQKQQQRQKEARDIEQEAASKSEDQSQHPSLKILPGESLSEFRQRVNAALPLTGVSRSSKNIAGLTDHRITKHERKLKRLQEGWRKEEARLREKEQEERELAEEEQDEIDAMWEDKTADLPTSTGGKKGKKKKGKRKLVVGEVDDGVDDEWEALKKKRAERRGLHDVVHEPPTFNRIPREVFKVKEGARVNVSNVPNSVGSLRKREELGVERQGIIETYRRLMAAKREG